MVGVVRIGTMRTSTSAIAFNGYAMWITPVNHTIYVALVEIAPLVEKADLKKLDDAPSVLQNRSLLKTYHTYAIVEVGMTLWVPYGYIPLVAGTEDYTSFITTPCLKKGLITEDLVDVSGLIRDANLRFAKISKDRKPWAAIYPEYAAYVGESS